MLAILLVGDPTQTGKTVEKLQLVLPRARVIYSSATGASEPNNLVCLQLVQILACPPTELSSASAGTFKAILHGHEVG